ncbi:hypothetical protein SAMN06296378_0939 [Salinibacterium xinjiangense]|uniref:BNR/Asp-box repeat-containing protein n=1 Tax=Salinibacterium xinjiangense TaxID=386302 RepID=A0A2C8Z6P6_9MICO|nr:exo-alpha-sialidase [Salinibacterium xinjiangense]SOE59445.1 hypothetical protein SAMN06296378_0939 [Salinibacterium xinjiangense]
MRPSHRRPGLLSVGTLLGTAAVLVGCSATPQVNQPAQPAGPTPIEHIHELTVDASSGVLVVATHEGIYDVSIASDAAATFTGPRAGLDFDPMGFVIAGDTTYASGHPGPTTPGSFGTPNLGLISSTDNGMTWTNISLTGQTDFHALAVGPPSSEGGAALVYGIDTSKPAIQRSSDGGVTWADGADLVARDILADPIVPGKLYATTEAGVLVSEDDAVTFHLDAAAPNLYLIDIDTAQQQLVGVDASGSVWRRATDTWIRGGTVTGVAQAFTSHDGRVYVADDRGIAFTDDDGATWDVLKTQ